MLEHGLVIMFNLRKIFDVLTHYCEYRENGEYL